MMIQENAKTSREDSDGLLARLLPQGRDAVSIVAYLIILFVLIVLVSNRVGGLPAWRFYSSILCVLGILLFHIFQPNIRLDLENQERADIAALLAISFLALAASWLSQNSITIYLPAMITGMAFFQLRFAIALIISLPVSGIWLFLASSFPYADELTLRGYVYSLALGAILFGAMGALSRRSNQQTEEAKILAEELRVANQELIATRQRDKELAAAEERMQLAREIHDGLGHHLTALNVQLQVAQKLLGESPAKVESILDTCRDEAQAALEEVRKSVEVMRSTPLDIDTLEDAIRRLVEDFDVISQFNVVFSMIGDPYETSRLSSLTCYRLVQEGLTNVQKHGQDVTEVVVALDYAPIFLLVGVKDDGRAAEIAEDKQGYGLIGLNERATQLGGTLRTGITDHGGFEIELVLPRS